MSEDSTYPLQTNTATKEFHRIENLRASTTQYGMTKLSNASDITDVNSAALSASEKNPNISGTLSNSIQQLSNKTQGMFIFYDYFYIDHYSVGKSFTKPLQYGNYLVFGDQHGGWSQCYGMFYLSCNIHAPLLIPIFKGVDCPTLTLDTASVLTAVPNVICEIAFNIFKIA